VEALNIAAPRPEAAHSRYEVRAAADVGPLRRSVAALAAACPGVRPGDAALVATELATNLLRHADAGGYVLFRAAGGGIEVLAVDRGPGMAPRAAPPSSDASGPGAGPPAPSGRLGAGLGVGLGSVRNLASQFDVYSRRPGGTVVLARLAAPPARPDWCRWGAVCVPCPGEVESGDGWVVEADDGMLAAVVVDGLGHGEGAAEAARAALGALDRRPSTDVEGYVRRAHEALRGTRGAVLGVCAVDRSRGQLSYAGVGNVAARVIQGQGCHGLAGRDGVLGASLAVPHAHVVRERWSSGSLLVLTSDGLRTHWDLSAYPGLPSHEPAVVAAVLQRDFQRGGDDVTVLVVADVRPVARPAP
jgi:anti-sigma regulatory factor (Ser/Thr protein kinase)